MAEIGADLSPRQRECLRHVWERQATSKEIAIELGIGKSTVDNYILAAVQTLGARDRRAAAAMLFGGSPRAEYPGHSTGVVAAMPAAAPGATSVQQAAGVLPWRAPGRPRNTLTLVQTIGWIAAIAIGSMVALALAAAIGDGLPRVSMPVIRAVHRLAH